MTIPLKTVKQTFFGNPSRMLQREAVAPCVQVTGGNVDIYGSNKPQTAGTVFADASAAEAAGFVKAVSGADVTGIITIATKVKYVCFFSISGTPEVYDGGVVQ